MKHPWLLAGLVGALILSAVLFVRTGSPGRDVSSVHTSLLGHWRAENGDNLYYAPDMAIALTPEGTTSYHPYRVLMANEDQSWVKLLIGNNHGREVERVIQFNEERDRYRTTTTVLTDETRVQHQSTMVYVDGRQSP